MPIEVDADIVYAASRGQSAALSTVLCAMYPPVCRLAIAISGSTQRGLHLVKPLLDQSLEASARWQDELGPWRWFMHHLILTLREHPATTREVDPLLQSAAGKDVPYASFLQAMRKLSPQQIEAFVLRHGEKLDERKVAIAMDCSVNAAVNHLAVATASLKLLAGDAFADRLAEFQTAYMNLSPDVPAVQSYVATRVRNYVVPKQTIRWTGRAIKLAAVLGVLYVLWQAWIYMWS